MTLDEFIAVRFASQLKIAKQDQVIDLIQEDYRQRLEAAILKPREVLQDLRDAGEEEHKACLHAVDCVPFKRGDFITKGDGDYYECDEIDIGVVEVEPDALVPPSDFLRVYLRGSAIRKNGALAKWPSGLGRVNLTDMGGYRKAEMSEDVCLRRAIKQRMRRRLEGGD